MTILYAYLFLSLLASPLLFHDMFQNGFYGFLGQSDFGGKSHHVIIAFGASFSAVFVIILIVGFIVWWRYRHNQQIFFDVNG